MSRSKRIPTVLDAIGQALASLSRLPETDEARALRDECLACEAIAKEWARSPPTAAEREAMTRRVLALHVSITKLRRRSRPPREG